MYRNSYRGTYRKTRGKPIGKPIGEPIGKPIVKPEYLGIPIGKPIGSQLQAANSAKFGVFSEVPTGMPIGFSSPSPAGLQKAQSLGVLVEVTRHWIYKVGGVLIAS